MKIETKIRLFKGFLAALAFVGAAIFLFFAWIELAVIDTFGVGWFSGIVFVGLLACAGYFVKRGIETIRRTDDFGIKAAHED